MNDICALIGTHGTGKTTAFDFVRAKVEGSSINFIPDLARECPYPVGTLTTPRSQLWILKEQQRREAMAQITICDKAIVDHYAYIIYWYGRRKNLERRLAEHAKKYKLFLKFPPTSAFLTGDSLRPVDPTFQIAIDEIIEQIIKDWKLEVERIPDKIGNDTPEWVYQRISIWLPF